MSKTKIAFLLLLFIPLTTAQEPIDEFRDHYTEYEIVAQPTIEVPFGGKSTFDVTFVDRSRDGPGGYGQDVPGIPVLSHTSTIKYNPLEDKPGWLLQPQTYSLLTISGDEITFPVGVLASPSARDPVFEFEINITTTDRYGGSKTTVMQFAAISPGLASFSAINVGAPLRLQPDGIGETRLLISNAAGFTPREFSVDVGNNPCNLEINTAPTLIPAGGQAETIITVVAPADKFWYNAESCLASLEVFASEAPTNILAVTLSAQVNGLYLNVDHLIIFLAATAALILILLILAYRKARIEEEILGKPQAPWTIPAEKVYLTHLKAKDKRSWYIVRHYLMEEEYQSSLLWYRAYKKATKGERKRERVIVAHEHVYDRFERKWAKRIARPEKRADRKKAQLEKKYARLHRKAHKEALRAYKKDVRSIEKAHDKKVKKALKKWSKLAKVAAKKGAQAPPQPHFDAPIHGDAPVKPEGDFESHKLAIKEARFRAKQMKKKLALQTKHAKGEAKVKAKVRRKVEKLAKKLDDPSFVDSLDALQ